MPLAHPFSFLVRRRDKKRDLRCFQLADVEANRYLEAALRRHGFELGETRINNPPRAGEEVDPTQLLHVDTDDCLPEDVIFSSIRLPADDPYRDYKKSMERAYTDLEQELIDVWTGALPIVSRGRVRLSPELARRLPDEYKDRFDMRFGQREGAEYLTLQAFDEKHRHTYEGDELRTAGFAMRLAKLPKRDVGYVGIWGLDGTSTLNLAYQIRHRHWDLLAEPGFAMIELVGDAIPERPTDYRWMLDWRAEVLFDVPFAAA